MALSLSRDPTPEDIRDFMDEDERRYWDTQQGTPDERVEFWRALGTLWRSIPDPTDAQLQTLMGHDWEYVKRTETRDSTLNFYRRKWKKDRKAAAREALQSEGPGSERKKKSSSERKALDQFSDSIINAQESEGAFQDIQSSQTPLLPTPLGEFDDISSLSKSDTEEGFGIADPSKTDPQSDDTSPTPAESSKPTGVRVHGSPGQATAQEQYVAALRRFMSEQVRAEYEKADSEKRAMLWDANERAFREFEKRREQNLLAETERTAKVLDMLQRLKEDPAKTHLLPPTDASMADLWEWYGDMSKPVRTVPFPDSSTRNQRAVPSTEPSPRATGIGRDSAIGGADTSRNSGRLFPAKSSDSKTRTKKGRAGVARDPKQIPPARPTLTTAERIGLVLAFLSVAAGFIIGALAAAGIINMGLAQLMLLAALIVMVIGTFVVEYLSLRSPLRIGVSTLLTTIISAVVLFDVISPWMIRKKAEQDALVSQREGETKAAPTLSSPSELVPSPSKIRSGSAPVTTPAAVQPTPISPPSPSPQRKLNKSEKIEGLTGRAQGGRSILWVGAHKAAMVPLAELDAQVRRWREETEAWLKQNVGHAYFLQFTNALLTGKKEYPGEIRENPPPAQRGIRKDLIDRLYTYVLKLEEILKGIEAEEN